MTEPYATANRSHAYVNGAVQSVCGQRYLPIEFSLDEDVPRCGNCQRRLVQQMATRYAPLEDRWREIATRSVMGDLWTYAELENMPSHRAGVDRVTTELANAFREGILQGNTSHRTVPE